MAIGNKRVQVLIDADVLQAAHVRAEMQAQRLSAICRAVVYRAAAGRPPTNPRRMRRRPESGRRRFKFLVDRDSHMIARKRSEQSGSSISNEIETALRIYAECGHI